MYTRRSLTRPLNVTTKKSDWRFAKIVLMALLLAFLIGGLELLAKCILGIAMYANARSAVVSRGASQQRTPSLGCGSKDEP